VQGRVRDGKLVPYYTRAEIEAGALSGRGYELAWLDDPVEAYFMHIQGSALLELEDGVRLQLSYAGSNGHPYRSIAKVLSEQGKLAGKTLTLRTLKEYLRAHPEEQPALFRQNPQWIFFRGVATGPLGSCDVPLTGGRSVAVDPTYYPHGAVGFLEVDPRPDSTTGQRTTRRFVFFQDSGSTVSGPDRVDVYWGSGAVAEAVASEIENPGRFYFLLPKE
jgi:membrane-bound lytic murein transglycosylase A